MEDRCFACEITITAGMLIKDFCKENCQQLVDEFMHGGMTIRDLQEKLNIPEEALEPFKQQDVHLDMTLAKAVEIENKHDDLTK